MQIAIWARLQDPSFLHFLVPRPSGNSDGEAAPASLGLGSPGVGGLDVFKCAILSQATSAGCLPVGESVWGLGEGVGSEGLCWGQRPGLASGLV